MKETRKHSKQGNNLIRLLSRFSLFIVISNSLLVGSLFAQNEVAQNSNEYFLDRADATKYAVIMTGPSVGTTGPRVLGSCCEC